MEQIRLTDTEQEICYKRVFNKYYESYLDYIHLISEKGQLYAYFLKEEHPEWLMEALSKPYPVHMSNVPAEQLSEYTDYLHNYLIGDAGICLDELEEHVLDCFISDVENDTAELLPEYMYVQTRYEMAKLLELFGECCQEMIDLWNASGMYTTTAIDLYPFDQSFDELFHDGISTWLSKSIKELKEDHSYEA